MIKNNILSEPPPLCRDKEGLEESLSWRASRYPLRSSNQTDQETSLLRSTIIGTRGKVELMRIIKMSLKALLFVLFPLCWCFWPSAGPGCFRALRTDTQQKVSNNVKHRYKIYIIAKNSDLKSKIQPNMSKMTTPSQDTQPQISLYLSGLHRMKVTGWMVAR